MKPLTSPAAANFDRVARVYRWAEYLALGPLLKRTREHFLGQLTGARVALALGDGDGRFAAALLCRVPELRLHAADSSAVMLELLRQRCNAAGALGRLTTEFAVAPDVALPPCCDLVVTHFFLDCLGDEEVRTLVNSFARQAPGGMRWVLSEFGIPHGRLAAPIGSMYIRLLYRIFRLLTGLHVQVLPPIHEALADAGFQRLARSEQLRGLLYAELWELPSPGRRGATRDGAPSSTPL